MPTARGKLRSRLQSLKNRHAVLSAQLENELKHPHKSEIALKRLKIEKLRLKEEIEMEAQGSG